MKFQVVKGEQEVILTVFIQDSSVTTGAGLGSLDQTSSITGGYLKRNSVGVALAVDENVTTEGTYEAPSTLAHVRIGTPANITGVAGTYELHFHNDLFTTEDWVTVILGGASNMVPLRLEIQLIGVDLNATQLPADLTYIHGTALTETSGQLAAAFKKLFDVGSPLLVASDVMVGTDGANTTTPPTVIAIRQEMDSNSVDLNAILEDTGSTLPSEHSTIVALLSTEIAEILADTDELQGDWEDGGRLDLLIDAIKAVTDALTAAAAAKLALSAGTIGSGIVSWDNTNATTTVFYASDITEATPDHLNGRRIGFTSGALAGVGGPPQYTAIEDYELVGGEGKFTVVALTEAPADNVTFVIV